MMRFVPDFGRSRPPQLTKISEIAGQQLRTGRILHPGDPFRVRPIRRFALAFIVILTIEGA